MTKLLQGLQKLRALGDPRRIAVYYRQSSEAQIGNVSTTLQTVEMIKILEEAGWSEEDIILVDMDGGVSGTKGIEERAGMSYLVYELIDKDRIVVVVVQAVDRLFRDRDQIDTNRFILACRTHKVQVLTPETLFDFNDDRYGDFLVKEFRKLTESGAEFIQHHVRGRLHPAREKKIRDGNWAGQGVPTGYMIDDRKRLPSGSENPDYRQPVIFRPYAGVVVAIYELFYEIDGNLLQQWKQMEEGRLSFPEMEEGMVPKGFRIIDQLKRRSRVTGARVPSYTTLIAMLTNPFYLGHFSYHGEILFWNHHPALVPEELFWYAFNKLSKTTLSGEPNPDYAPHRKMMVRGSSKDRPESPPVYQGMIYSNDIVDSPNIRVGTQWTKTMSCYAYRLAISQEGRSYWAVTARNVDKLLHDMLKEAMMSLALDEDSWQNALQSWTVNDHKECQRLEQQLQQEKQARENILGGIRTFTDDEMRQRAEDNLKAVRSNIHHLEEKLKALQLRDQTTLKDAREVLNKIVSQWGRVPNRRKRELMELLAEKIEMNRIQAREKLITVYWRSGNVTSRVLSHVKGRGQPWSNLDRDNLKYMIEHNVDQVEILRQFPDKTWRNILDQYAYHFNNGNREGVYQGYKKYPQYVNWEQTEEYRQSQRGESGPSSTHSIREVTYPTFSPSIWFDLTEPQVLKRLRTFLS